MSRSNHELRDRRHRRVRKKVSGTSERPRLAVFRSNKHIYVQAIDDVSGRTVAAASTMEASLRSGSTATVDAENNLQVSLPGFGSDGVAQRCRPLQQRRVRLGR